MAYHLLSALGDSLYEPVRYQDGTFISNIQEYVQLALIERFHTELSDKDARITIFVTNRALQKNWENRILGEWEVARLNAWSNGLSTVQVNDTKPGLDTQLHQAFPTEDLADRVNPVTIPNGSSEKEIAEIFQKMYDSLREGDEIIFDITNAFRSIPMLAMTVINYAKVMKNCRLKGIYYGAYDASDKGKSGEKIVPIFNLTMYNDILAWTNAANVFAKYGNSSLMRDIYYEKVRDASPEQRRQWSDLKSIVNAASSLSDSIQASRGIGAADVRGKSKDKISIQAAARNYQEACGKLKESRSTEFMPIYPLINKTRDAYRVLNQEDNCWTGFAVVRWCIDHDMIQQGYTALEETIITYICQLYGVSEAKRYVRMNIVGRTIGKMASVKDIDCAGVRAGIYEEMINFEEGKKEYPITDPREKEVVKNICMTLDAGWLSLLHDVQNFRNDINHFGMREDPKTTDVLKEQLRKNYQRFAEYMDDASMGIPDGRL